MGPTDDMTPERWRRVEGIFNSAVRLEPASRSSFLAVACAGDEELRREVEALLTSDQRAQQFLEGFALEMAETVPLDRDLSPLRADPARQQLGPYRIVAALGAGGMGEVYSAFDARLQRKVAVKLLPQRLADDPQSLERFKREARAASALNHENICSVHDIGEREGQPFLVMELLEGETLKERLSSGPPPPDKALDLAVQVAGGLQAAHAKGIIHRDIKPGNLFITSRGQAKILDFGLAKLLSEPPPPQVGDPAAAVPAREEAVSRTGAVLGTAAYASPEQAEGKPVDTRSDVFSFGAVLYEMLTGQRAFQGESQLGTLSAVVRNTPAAVRQLRPEVPEALERIVHRCLHKNPDDRYESAAELWRELRSLQSGRARRAGFQAMLRNPRVAVPAVVLLALVAVTVGWLWKQNARVRWARMVALPEIARLTAEGRTCAAFRLIQHAERDLPGDRELERLRGISTDRLSIRTNPPGADVYVRDYFDVADRAQWMHLGRTPLDSAVIPVGVIPYRIAKRGFETVDGTTEFATLLDVSLAAEGSNPPGMVRVPPQKANLFNLVLAQPERDLALEEFWLDKTEVTNAQFKEFVDRGGYQKKEYWRHPFVEASRVIRWEEAMTAFRDATGRPGPATWEFGSYPKDQAEYPVSGVSWYEAAAYAEFAGKSLPTVHHWRSAAGLGVYASILQVSNFSGEGPARVGSHRGLSPYGTYDMAGNVREWCWNLAGPERYILGGAWNDPSYAFYGTETRAPTDRSAGNGFRCARYTGPLPEELTDAVPLLIRDRRGDQPAGDDVFRVYQAIHQYDRSELKPALEAPDDRNAHWRLERVSFQAAYGNERVGAHIHLPNNTDPPYQTVVFFPGGYCLDVRTRQARDLSMFDFLIRSGRALVYPTYKGTYERTLGGSYQTYRRQPNLWREMAIQWAKDLGRTLDYLETRADIDREKLAYFGISMGAVEGPRLMALSPRLKVGLLLWGGSWERGWPTEVDPFHFAPRVTAPILMVNGRDDFWFHLEASQVPLFRFLGSPAKDKRHVVVEGGHAPLNQDVIREVLEWLDRYLGPVTAR